MAGGSKYCNTPEPRLPLLQYGEEAIQNASLLQLQQNTAPELWNSSKIENLKVINLQILASVSLTV